MSSNFLRNTCACICIRKNKRCEKFPKFIPHKTQPYTNTEDTHSSTHTSIQYFLFPIPSCLSTESLAKCGIIYYTVRPFVAILPAWYSIFLVSYSLMSLHRVISKVWYHLLHCETICCNPSCLVEVCSVCETLY